MVLSFRFRHKITVCIYPSWFDHPKNTSISLVVKILEVLITLFSPDSCHSCNIQSWSPTRSPYSSSNLREQFLHLRTLTDKTIVLPTVIALFADSIQEGKRFWTEWQEALLDIIMFLTLSSTQLQFVSTLPKHLKCAIFLQDLLFVFML